MRETFRLELPPAIAAQMDQIAEERGITRPGLMREALGLLRLAHEATRDGHYVGVTAIRENLETIMVLPL